MDEELELKHSSAVRTADELLCQQEERLNAVLSARVETDETPRKTKQKKPTNQETKSEMGPDAVIKLQRVKLKTLAEDLEKSKNRIKLLEQKCSSSKVQGDAIAKMTQKIQLAQASKEKFQADVASKQSRIEQLENEIISLTKENNELKKVPNPCGSNNDIRLNRALEDIDKYKLKIKQLEAGKKEAGLDVEQEIKRLQTENKKLEKQNKEVISGFKKQLQLIDVLKRQKIHLQAAKMLAFTEDEFTRTIDGFLD